MSLHDRQQDISFLGSAMSKLEKDHNAARTDDALKMIAKIARRHVKVLGMQPMDALRLALDGYRTLVEDQEIQLLNDLWERSE